MSPKLEETITIANERMARIEATLPPKPEYVKKADVIAAIESLDATKEAPSEENASDSHVF